MLPYIMLSELFAPFIRNVLPIHCNGVIGNIPNVAHSRISKMEEELKCPVCLDFFKSPVRMTPCGHNYCEECLTGIGLGCPRD